MQEFYDLPKNVEPKKEKLGRRKSRKRKKEKMAAEVLKVVKTDFEIFFFNYIEKILKKCLEFLRTDCNEIVHTSDNSLVNSFCKLFKCLLIDNPSFFKGVTDS